MFQSNVWRTHQSFDNLRGVCDVKASRPASNIVTMLLRYSLCALETLEHLGMSCVDCHGAHWITALTRAMRGTTFQTKMLTSVSTT